MRMGKKTAASLREATEFLSFNYDPVLVQD